MRKNLSDARAHPVTATWRSRAILSVESASLWGLIVGASAHVIVYIFIVAARLTYPFELEWMEGGAVVHVDRILRGQPLYAQPSLEFTAFVYAPLYFYVSAAFALLLGVGFIPLRLVSFLSSVGCLIFIFLIVRRRTGATLPAVLSSCLFAAAFRVTGAWFDIARVDSLFMCLLLAAIYAFWSPNRIARTVVAGVLLFLAFFTKQSTLVAGAGLMAAALLRRHGSERLMLPILFGLLVIGTTVAMNAGTGGWYGYYVFDLPAQHQIEGAYLLGFWTRDLALNFPVAIVMTITVVMNERRKQWATQGIEDAAILGGLVMASYLARIHSGGYANVLMPAVAGFSIFFGIGCAQAQARLTGQPLGRALLFVCAALQFFLLSYSPLDQIPSAADRKA